MADQIDEYLEEVVQDIIIRDVVEEGKTNVIIYIARYNLVF